MIVFILLPKLKMKFQSEKNFENDCIKNKINENSKNYAVNHPNELYVERFYLRIIVQLSTFGIIASNFQFFVGLLPAKELYL